MNESEVAFNSVVFVPGSLNIHHWFIRFSADTHRRVDVLLA
jgi:hypothetical protein